MVAGAQSQLNTKIETERRNRTHQKLKRGIPKRNVALTCKHNRTKKLVSTHLKGVSLLFILARRGGN